MPCDVSLVAMSNTRCGGRDRGMPNAIGFVASRPSVPPCGATTWFAPESFVITIPTRSLAASRAAASASRPMCELERTVATHTP